MQQKKIKLVLLALFHCVSSLADHVVVLHAAIPHGFSSVPSLTHTQSGLRIGPLTLVVGCNFWMEYGVVEKLELFLTI